VELRAKGDPVLYVTRPAGVSLEQQGDIIAAGGRLNRLANAAANDPEIATRIAQ